MPFDDPNRALRYPGAVQEIADVLARQQRKEPREVWTEAIALYNVRFERNVLVLDEEGRVVELGRIEYVYADESPQS